MEKQEQEKKENAAGLGTLAGYGDSDVSSDEEADITSESAVPLRVEPAQVQESDNVAREARRTRAKEWAERRRGLASDTTT